jgi:hypothetical protein
MTKTTTGMYITIYINWSKHIYIYIQIQTQQDVLEQISDVYLTIKQWLELIAQQIIQCANNSVQTIAVQW